MTTGLPPKLYFRIGEVSSLVGVEPHVLRYWEREFRVIRPTKSAKGQRVYSRRDVENLQRVRELLYTDGFTIAGARKKLQKHNGAEGDAEGGAATDGALALSNPTRESSSGGDDSGPTDDGGGDESERPKVLRATDPAKIPPNEPGNDRQERTLTQLRELRSEVQAFLEELGG